MTSGRNTSPASQTHRRVFGGVAVVVLFLLVSFAADAASAVDPPFFEPKEGYYNARGPRVTAEWAVDRTEVPEDGRITATLIIRGATNPQEIVRPDLGKVQAPDGRTFADLFQIEDAPQKPVPTDATEVAFVYYLRPRNRSVNRLPTLDFRYNTGASTGDPYQLTRARGLAITVTAAAPKSKAKPPPVPLSEPNHLFELATGPDLLAREPFEPGLVAWLLLAMGAPALAAVWYALWRRIYPDAARNARARRSRAFRQGLEGIRRGSRAADPARAVASAVVVYLQSRFPLPPGADTPAEVGDGLRAAGLPDESASVVVAFLRRCDAARFAPTSASPGALVTDAEALLHRLEGVK